MVQLLIIHLEGKACSTLFKTFEYFILKVKIGSSFNHRKQLCLGSKSCVRPVLVSALDSQSIISAANTLTGSLKAYGA